MNLCTYSDESDKVTGTKTIVPELLAHKELLRALQAVQTNLAFSKTQVEKGLRLLVPTTAERLTKMSDVKDWCHTLGKRIRNMCRATNQAANRKRSPKFVSRLELAAFGRPRPEQPAGSKT